MKKKGLKKWIKKHPFGFGAICLSICFLIWVFWPVSDVVFHFIYEPTGEGIPGEVYFDDEFFGFADKGRIDIPYMEDFPSEITFKGEYNGTEFEYFYDFPEDYWDYYENEFLVDEMSNEVILYFYELKTGCNLSGDVYVSGKFIGEAKNGELFLSKKVYVEEFSDGVELKMKGLTDSCFDKNSNLPFVEFWIVSGLEDSFFSDEILNFETELNPREPIYPEAIQGFIRPYEVESVLLEINFDEEDSYLEDVEKILATTYLTYFSDKGQFGEIEYWQTPGEFAKSRQGDCEDWAVYSVSLLRSYDSNLDCYLAIGYIHANVICNINQTFIMFDQYGIEESFSLDEYLSFQENQIKTRKWKDNYFENYGFTPEERIIWFLINDEELIEFEDGRTDFTDWVVNKGLESFNQ